jgi:hypothetical protein
MLSKPVQPSFASQSDIEFECLLFLTEAHQARQKELARSNPQSKTRPGATSSSRIQSVPRGVGNSKRTRVA